MADGHSRLALLGQLGRVDLQMHLKSRQKLNNCPKLLFSVTKKLSKMLIYGLYYHTGYGTIKTVPQFFGYGTSIDICVWHMPAPRLNTILC